MELVVDIKINPLQAEVDVRRMDELLDGELLGFERWFISRQRAKGLGAGPLIGAERGAVKAYLIYCVTGGREGAPG